MVDISDFYQNSTVPQLMNEPVETAVEKIEQANLTPVVIGSGTQRNYAKTFLDELIEQERKKG